MSVDFPAPFSPISAWISPALMRKVTSSSARTLRKSLVRWSMESSMPLLRQSYRARTPAVEGDGRDDQRAKQELHPIGINLGEHQPVLDERNHQHGKDGPDNRDVAAGKRGAADDRGGEGEQQPVVADQGLRRAELRDGKHRPDRG